jgi:hypothetical protein
MSIFKIKTKRNKTKKNFFRRKFQTNENVDAGLAIMSGLSGLINVPSKL